MNRRDFISMALIGASSPAAAHGYKTRSIDIAHPWTFEQPGKGGDAVIGMTIRNKGKAPDSLLRVETADAERAELRNQGLVVGKIDLASGEEVTFHANGPHVLLKGVRKTMFAYNNLHMTMVFAWAGKIKVEVVVEDRPS